MMPVKCWVTGSNCDQKAILQEHIHHWTHPLLRKEKEKRYQTPKDLEKIDTVSVFIASPTIAIHE